MSAFIQSASGEVHESDVVSSSSGKSAPESNSVLATATRQSIGGVPDVLRPDTLVTVPNSGGMQITLRQAEREGLVKRDTKGNYSEVEQGNGFPAHAEPNPHVEDDGATPFAPQQEAMFEHFTAQLPPAIQQATVEAVIARGIESLDMQAAETSGMEHGQYREGVCAVVGLFQAQGDQYFRMQGIDPTEFTAWAHEKAPKEIKAAMRQHVVSRSPVAYNSLITRFLNGTAPTAAALNAGGKESRTERNGTDMVNIPGVGWTTAIAAAKAGLI
jgi:hypothetical protein